MQIGLRKRTVVFEKRSLLSVDELPCRCNWKSQTSSILVQFACFRDSLQILKHQLKFFLNNFLLGIPMSVIIVILATDYTNYENKNR